MKVKLEGYDEAIALLKGLKYDAVNRKVMMSAERSVLAPVVSDMKSRLDAGAKKLTGNLSASIGVKVLRGSKQSSTTSLAGVRMSGKFVGFHGHIIDKGTVDRFYKKPRLIKFKTNDGREVIAKVSGTGQVRATHFASSSIQANKDKVLSNFKNEVVKALERYMNRKARKTA